jgi:hypothetical protein
VNKSAGVPSWSQRLAGSSEMSFVAERRSSMNLERAASAAILPSSASENDVPSAPGSDSKISSRVSFPESECAGSDEKQTCYSRKSGASTPEHCVTITSAYEPPNGSE